VGEELVEDRQDVLGQGPVVRLARVERDARVVRDPVLPRAVRFEAQDVVEVVAEGPGAGPRLAHPERGLDHDPHARQGELLVVVGHPRDHVNVRVEDVHERPPSSGPAS